MNCFSHFLKARNQKKNVLRMVSKQRPWYIQIKNSVGKSLFELPVIRTKFFSLGTLNNREFAVALISEKIRTFTEPRNKNSRLESTPG